MIHTALLTVSQLVVTGLAMRATAWQPSSSQTQAGAWSSGPVDTAKSPKTHLTLGQGFVSTPSINLGGRFAPPLTSRPWETCAASSFLTVGSDQRNPVTDERVAYNLPKPACGQGLPPVTAAEPSPVVTNCHSEELRFWS